MSTGPHEIKKFIDRNNINVNNISLLIELFTDEYSIDYERPDEDGIIKTVFYFKKTYVELMSLILAFFTEPQHLIIFQIGELKNEEV